MPAVSRPEPGKIFIDGEDMTELPPYERPVEHDVFSRTRCFRT